MTGEYFPLLDWLAEQGKKIFVDLKFFDVPATVARAVRQLHGRGVTFTTVHGNDAMMKAAADAKGDVAVLAGGRIRAGDPRTAQGARRSFSGDHPRHSSGRKYRRPKARSDAD